jgi:hypothetical protein
MCSNPNTIPCIDDQTQQEQLLYNAALEPTDNNLGYKRCHHELTLSLVTIETFNSFAIIPDTNCTNCATVYDLNKSSTSIYVSGE